MAIAAHWSLLLVVIAFWVLVYMPTIERERQAVSGMFPDEYGEYAANVPAFFPRASPWQRSNRREKDAFSFALYMRHREWQAALGYAGAMTWLWLRMTEVF